MNATANRVAFVRWVRQHYPDAYEQAAARALAHRYAPRGRLGDLTESVSNAFDAFTSALTKITPTYTQIKTDIDALKLNIQRVRAGLPIEQKGSAPPPPPPPNSPAARVETQLATDAPSAASGVPTWVWIIGAVVLARML